MNDKPIRREEFLVAVREHIAQAPRRPVDHVHAEEWTKTAASMLEALANEMTADMKATGGTFAEELRSLVAKHVLADPKQSDQAKEATLAPGVLIRGVTVSAVTYAGAYLDIRIQTGVFR